MTDHNPVINVFGPTGSIQSGPPFRCVTCGELVLNIKGLDGRDRLVHVKETKP